MNRVFTVLACLSWAVVAGHFAAAEDDATASASATPAASASATDAAAADGSSATAAAAKLEKDDPLNSMAVEEQWHFNPTEDRSDPWYDYLTELRLNAAAMAYSATTVLPAEVCAETSTFSLRSTCTMAAR